MQGNDRPSREPDFIRPENALIIGGRSRRRRERTLRSNRQSAGRPARPNIVRTAMRISARNQIKGTVVEVKKGATTSHIRVDIGNGQVMTSSITNEAVDELGIKARDSVTVMVKASDVMIAVD
jgi:molybdopterin-binding protein